MSGRVRLLSIISVGENGLYLGEEESYKTIVSNWSELPVRIS